jgi:quercetin dioxygenase-like cupin family protein
VASRPEALTDRRAVDRLTADGLSYSRWSNGPGDRYAEHRHGYDKVLVATRGSIVFTMPEVGGDVELSEGDRLDLPAGVTHGAFVGPGGVACLEAHLPPGSLGAVPHHHPSWAASDDGPAETGKPARA